MTSLSAQGNTGALRIDLDVSEEEIAKLFEPFVESFVEPGDDTWNEEISRRRRKIFKRYAKRRLLGWLPAQHRNEKVIVDEYTRAWQNYEYSRYILGRPLAKVTPWKWHRRRMFASDLGATRVRQVLLVRILEQLKPRSVLEVGCGNGINLLLLACRFPEISFTGVELTSAGHESAREFQKREALPEAICDYAPLSLADSTAFRRIEFLQGSATDLAFEDSAFDLVFTSLAIEQMERGRHDALSEIARVAGGHTLMIEPFRDVNTGFWPRLNVLGRNYFRGSIEELNGCGLRPVLMFDDFPQEMFLRVCAVLSEKESGVRAGVPR